MDDGNSCNITKWGERKTPSATKNGVTVRKSSIFLKQRSHESLQNSPYYFLRLKISKISAKKEQQHSWGKSPQKKVNKHPLLPYGKRKGSQVPWS